MRAICLVVLTCFIFVGAGCSPISVKTDYDNSVDFSQYKTFGWMEMKKSPRAARSGHKEVFIESIKRAVEQELVNKGYTFVDRGRTDIRIAYHVGVENHVDVQHYGYGPWRRHGRTEVRRYKEGTFVLDFVETKDKLLVWRGWASALAGDPIEAEDRIKQAVIKMMEKYPPEV